MEDPALLKFNVERLKRLPLQPNTVWEGGWRELPEVRIGGEDPATSFFAGMWVATESNTVGPGRDMLHTAASATAAKLLDLLADFANDGQLTGYRPGTIKVPTPELANWLARELDGTEINVAMAAELPAWELAASDMESFLSKGPGGTASISLFAQPGVTTDQIICFGDAAAEFHQAAKWDEFCDQDLFRVVAPGGGPGLNCTVILGWAGIEYGLGFYDSTEEHDRLQSAGDRETFTNRKTPLWFFSFNERREKDFRELFAEWDRMGMPVAGQDAYPLLLCHHPTKGPQTAGPAELEFVTGLLLALARTETTDANQGRWTVTVPVGGREAAYTLELPYVLKPLGLPDILRWHNLPDPRVNDDMFEAIGKMMGKDLDDDPDTLPAKLSEKLVGKTVDEIMAEAEIQATPDHEADKLCFEAYNTIGFMKQILARKALAIDPTCIRAYNILAEENSNPEQSLAYHQQAVTIARDRFDFPALQKDWDDLNYCRELRPSLRALAGRAIAADRLGQLDEAMEYGLEFLDLSPSDGAGLRHLVVGRLLAHGRNDDADRLLVNWHKEFLEPPVGSLDLDAEVCMDFGGDRLFVAVANLILAANQGLDKNELAARRREIRT